MSDAVSFRRKQVQEDKCQFKQRQKWKKNNKSQRDLFLVLDRIFSVEQKLALADVSTKGIC